MLELLSQPSTWIAFATLSALEIVLGIDNIIFISVLVARLPESRRDRARLVGLALAMITRIALLFSIVWLTKLTQPWFTLVKPFSGRDLVLLFGGLFLIAKSVTEIHETLEGAANDRQTRVFAHFVVIVVQIAIIDIIFSLDSVFTAVGLAEPGQVPVMVAAIVLAILVMMAVSGALSRFVDRHPTIKMLALSFLILVGFALMGEGLGLHIPKGYLYFAMAFSVAVELVNLRLRSLLDRRRGPD
jgi:predicted tellurium resistance membrane protein TerC